MICFLGFSSQQDPWKKHPIATFWDDGQLKEKCFGLKILEPSHHNLRQITQSGLIPISQYLGVSTHYLGQSFSMELFFKMLEFPMHCTLQMPQNQLVEGAQPNLVFMKKGYRLEMRLMLGSITLIARNGGFTLSQPQCFMDWVRLEATGRVKSVWS